MDIGYTRILISACYEQGATLQMLIRCGEPHPVAILANFSCNVGLYASSHGLTVSTSLVAMIWNLSIEFSAQLS